MGHFQLWISEDSVNQGSDNGGSTVLFLQPGRVIMHKPASGYNEPIAEVHQTWAQASYLEANNSELKICHFIKAHLVSGLFLTSVDDLHTASVRPCPTLSVCIIYVLLTNNTA